MIGNSENRPFNTPARTLILFLAAYCCGLMLSWLHFPLPWLVGAILAAFVLRTSGFHFTVPRWARPLGQVAVASSIGLLFTPAALLDLQTLIWPILVAAVGTILVGLACAAVLARMSGMDFVSAGLATIPIGPVESATVANRLERDPGPIIFAQTLRILLIVIIIPALIIGSAAQRGTPTATLQNVHWTWQGIALLGVAGAVGASLALRIRLSNPFFLGPLALSALGAALSLPLSPLPYAGLVSAQILLGCWLGAAFDAALLVRRPKLVMAMLVSNVLLLILCAAMALTISRVTGVDWHITVLGTAPGSVTEMALSAKILGNGVATVISFHLVRVFVVLPIAPWVLRHLARSGS